MAHVQNVDAVFSHSKQDSIFVLSSAMENLADFKFEKFVFRSKRTAFGENFQRTYCIINTIKPRVCGSRVPFGEP